MRVAVIDDDEIDTRRACQQTVTRWPWVWTISGEGVPILGPTSFRDLDTRVVRFQLDIGPGLMNKWRFIRIMNQLN